MRSGIGIDMVEITRVEALISRFSQRFLNKIFDPVEQTYCLKKARPAMHFAARFAAKEALAKALYQSGVTVKYAWRDLAVHHDDLGRPKAVVQGQQRNDIQISISHEKHYAIAVAFIVGPT